MGTTYIQGVFTLCCVIFALQLAMIPSEVFDCDGNVYSSGTLCHHWHCDGGLLFWGSSCAAGTCKCENVVRSTYQGVCQYDTETASHMVDCGEEANGAAGEQAYIYHFSDTTCTEMNSQEEKYCTYDSAPNGLCDNSTCSYANTGDDGDDGDDGGIEDQLIVLIIVLITLVLFCVCTSFFVSYLRAKGMCLVHNERSVEPSFVKLAKEADGPVKSDDMDMEAASGAEETKSVTINNIYTLEMEKKAKRLLAIKSVLEDGDINLDKEKRENVLKKQSELNAEYVDFLLDDTSLARGNSIPRKSSMPAVRKGSNNDQKDAGLTPQKSKKFDFWTTFGPVMKETVKETMKETVKETMERELLNVPYGNTPYNHPLM